MPFKGLNSLKSKKTLDRIPLGAVDVSASLIIFGLVVPLTFDLLTLFCQKLQSHSQHIQFNSNYHHLQYNMIQYLICRVLRS